MVRTHSPMTGIATYDAYFPLLPRMTSVESR